MKRAIGAGLGLVLTALTAACQPAAPPPAVNVESTAQHSGVATSLRGLTVVDAMTAWVGAPDGVVLRTIDGGQSWTRSRIEAAAGLDLRSAHGFDAEHALFFTAGSPARLFETRDGGASFTLVYEDAASAAFFDGLAFWDDSRGIAFSDPVDGVFHILLSEDGGLSWTEADGLPAPLEGEAGFAASDSSLAVGPEGRVWIGTGGGARARVLMSDDYGASWDVVDTPLANGEAGAGIFSIAVAGNNLVAVGGDYTRADTGEGVAAYSLDRGRVWFEPANAPTGYRSGVAAIPGQPGHFLAVGPNGADLSRDGGRTWETVALSGLNAIAFAPSSADGWAVGAGGQIQRIRVDQAME
ncbi:WD40/YVTN/BNR-like repeat-containing protein [Maricaulis sp.]|uniref:WD40/YVTN/BNR-like repeat-containing protein n=1 Tax=Maricaulis sp. TaxID=1486257 RepID=UPI003A927B42